MSGAQPLTLALPPRIWASLLIAGLISFLFVLILVALAVQSWQLSGAEASVQAAYRRQIVMAEMSSTLKDAETAQRGYILTGHSDFLAPYDRARSAMPGLLAKLHRQAEAGGLDHSPQTQRIERLTWRKLAEMQRTRVVRDTQGLIAASRDVAAGEGTALMDAIRREIASINRNDAQALARQQADAQAQRAWTKRIYTVCLLLIAIGGVLLAYMLWYSRRTRHAALQNMLDAHALQKAIFDNAFNAIILIDPRGSIEIMNHAAERLFGFSAAEMLRRDIATIVDIAAGEGPFLDRLGLGPKGLAQPFRPVMTAQCSDGGTVQVEVALGTIALEDGVHIVASLRDISERGKVEQIKDQFLSTVSHELRTPLTSIVGALGLLRGGAVAPLPPAVQRLVVIAENNANRLIRIVNDILDAEKLQSGAMAFDFHSFNLREMLVGAVDAMRGLADTRGVTLNLRADGPLLLVRGDSERLVQVIANLLSNAVKFSPRLSTVQIEVDDDGHRARISVIDAGSGIAPAMRDRLFTRFAQGTRSETDITGTGLGLSIASDIVHNHGGRIWHEDAPGGGSIFRLTLPIWNVATRQDDPNDAPRLLVYAEEGEAQAISQGFAARAIRADAVTSVEAVRTAVGTRPYLALILDVGLAGEQAVPLLEAIRANPGSRTLPVIAIAAETPSAHADAMASLDIIDWINKPIAPDRLDEAIGMAIDHGAIPMPLVLHIDGDSDTLAITARALRGVARMARATDLKSARAFLAEHRVDIAIVDMALPDGSGAEIIAYLAEADETGTPIIIYSAQDSDAAIARNVQAVLTKSRLSLPSLVDVVMAILARRDRAEDAPI